MIEGLQGIRKSSFLKALGGEWYCSATLALGDKDSKMIASSNWLIELPDMASFKKSERNALKAFFSTDTDHFRLPYGKTILNVKRRSVFVATSNDGDYLDDPTGNRRYVCVLSSGVDLAKVIADRDQIWAEAVYLYDQHQKCENKLECGCWWFVGDEAKLVESEAEKRVLESPYEDIFAAWWHDMAPEKRPTVMTGAEVTKAFGIDVDPRFHKDLQMTVGAILRKLGWTKKQIKKNGKPTWVWYPNEEWVNAPQSAEGKAKDLTKPKVFDVLRGGKT